MVSHFVNQLLEADDGKLEFGDLIDLLAELVELLAHEGQLARGVGIGQTRVLRLGRVRRALPAPEQLQQLAREQDLVGHLQVDVGGQLGARQRVLRVAGGEAVVACASTSIPIIVVCPSGKFFLPMRVF